VSAQDCQVPTPTSQKLRAEWNFGFTESTINKIIIITHQLLGGLNLTIHPVLEFPPRRQLLRSWGSEVKIESVQFFLQFLSEPVVFKGQWPAYVETWSHQVRGDSKMSPQLCNFCLFFALSPL
jgi:hypothetical protein